VKREIIAYISEEILGEDAPPDLAEDTPLLSSGLLDSLSVEQLLLYLEDEHGVAFDESDYSAENFETVNAIEALVRRRLEAGSVDDGSVRPA
jgi:acyl carrier protein